LATPPLSLWLPYELYRRSHLIHHRDERLTDPLDDPESYYWTRENWRALGKIGRALFLFQTTFVGRLIIGPFWNVACFFAHELGLFLKGDYRHAGVWLRHMIGVVIVLIWVTKIAHMSALFYIFGIVYPGTSILLIRSFAEHRATEGVFERTAIVENAPLLGPLFLFNNLHAAHHAEPMMPWYEIPAWYRANRARLIRENGGLLYDGYRDVARRFLFKPHDKPEHPTNRAPFADGHFPEA
jgi:fatty acid desaturase